MIAQAAPPSVDISLYVHVPFCTRTCPYCDFYQVRWEADREAAFVEGVLDEARLVRAELGAANEPTVTL